MIHRAGFWALVFLGVTLAVTPFRRIARYGNLIDVRRMLGVGSFCYIATHLTLFTADQMFDLGKVVHEISHRWYLIIGGTAWLGLATLAATSTDGMVRRLGGMRWRRLHQAVYGIALLALIHYFQQTKADVTVPIFAASLFLWLIALPAGRLVAGRRRIVHADAARADRRGVAAHLYRRGGRHRHRVPRLADARARRGVRFRRRHPAGLAGARRGPCGGRDRFCARPLAVARTRPRRWRRNERRGMAIFRRRAWRLERRLGLEEDASADGRARPPADHADLYRPRRARPSGASRYRSRHPHRRYPRRARI